MKKIIQGLLLLVIIAFLGFSYNISDQVASGITHLSDPSKSLENSLTFLIKQEFDYQDFIKKHPIQEEIIESSFFGHDIPISQIKTDQSFKGAVIMVHGLGGSKESTYHLAPIFLDLGYDVYAFDQRNEGKNTATTNTFGYLESKDLIDVVNFVRPKLQDSDSLILWGESFGGATVGIAAKELQDQVDYLILDSPMENARYMTEIELKKISQETGLPLDYMMTLGDWNLKLTHGFTLADTQVSRYIQEVTTPLLLFHSKADEVIPYQMGQAIYEASPAQDKKLVTYQDAQHVLLYQKDPDRYIQAIQDFLK